MGSKKSGIRVAMFCAAAGTMLSACGGGSDHNPPPPPPPPPTYSLSGTVSGLGSTRPGPHRQRLSGIRSQRRHHHRAHFVSGFRRGLSSALCLHSQRVQRARLPEVPVLSRLLT